VPRALRGYVDGRQLHLRGLMRLSCPPGRGRKAIGRRKIRQAELAALPQESGIVKRAVEKPV
jgi:hypothetical protein